MHSYGSFFDSAAFRNMMFSFSIVTLFLAAAFVVVAFAYYGRTRDVYGDTREEQRWTLLMGTWRDSLIVTILYLSEATFYRFMAFSGHVQTAHEGFALYVLGFGDVALLCLHVASFTIVILRIILISRWLGVQKTLAASRKQD